LKLVLGRFKDNKMTEKTLLVDNPFSLEVNPKKVNPSRHLGNAKQAPIHLVNSCFFVVEKS